MLLAVDAGGTSTRALVLDESGRAYGYGRAGSGNPTSAGVAEAREAILAAVHQAGGAGSLAVIAMAGVQSRGFAGRLAAGLADAGWPRVSLRHDLLAIFCSGTWRDDGYALIAGTGSVAARVAGGRLDRVVGGRGWLLGDAGSGFWIGRRVARAVVAALDGQQVPTALTDLMLEVVGVAPGPSALAELVPLLYARRPVQLAEFAPLAFAVPDDPTARAILVAASAALADLVTTVRVPHLDGPVVGGGSVLVRGLLAAPPELAADLVPLAGQAEVVTVPDGVVGAAVLALREAGIAVGEDLFGRVQAEVARVST